MGAVDLDRNRLYRRHGTIQFTPEASANDARGLLYEILANAIRGGAGIGATVAQAHANLQDATPIDFLNYLLNEATIR